MASLVALAACGRSDGPPLDAEAVRVGALVYGRHCASCHGARGEGASDWKRADARGVLPPPPHDSTGHTWHHADGLLFRIVDRGTAAALGDPSLAARTAMPPFGDSLSAAEIRAVLTYIKTWWTPEQRAMQVEASRDDPLP